MVGHASQGHRLRHPLDRCEAVSLTPYFTRTGDNAMNWTTINELSRLVLANPKLAAASTEIIAAMMAEQTAKAKPKAKSEIFTPEAPV